MSACTAKDEEFMATLRAVDSSQFACFADPVLEFHRSLKHATFIPASGPVDAICYASHGASVGDSHNRHLRFENRTHHKHLHC